MSCKEGDSGVKDCFLIHDLNTGVESMSFVKQEALKEEKCCLSGWGSNDKSVRFWSFHVCLRCHGDILVEKPGWQLDKCM